MIFDVAGGKEAGSIPAGVIGFFPSDRTMARGSTQPLTEMSTRSISLGGKGGRCMKLTTYHNPVLLSRNLGTLASWNPLGPSRPFRACNGTDLPLPFTDAYHEEPSSEQLVSEPMFNYRVCQPDDINAGQNEIM